ncbi:protein kinase [Tahibacter sp.]|uniref:serine/threonine-protein kinase n=1 Tax=Tahibacter sp. TaxID=2056211 RepID=UPI0031BB7B2C
MRLEQRLLLFRQVLAAVSHAHQHLLVHRDIRSGNILVDASGQIRLLDFGIAKALDATEATATRDRYLSFGNAAPEQLLGGPISVACDIYALGSVLYELLCGLPPFALQGMTAAALEAQILQVPPPPMARRIAGASATVAKQRGLDSVAALQRRLDGDLDARHRFVRVAGIIVDDGAGDEVGDAAGPAAVAAATAILRRVDGKRGIDQRCRWRRRTTVVRFLVAEVAAEFLKVDRRVVGFADRWFLIVQLEVRGSLHAGEQVGAAVAGAQYGAAVGRWRGDDDRWQHDLCVRWNGRRQCKTQRERRPAACCCGVCHKTTRCLVHVADSLE